MTDHAKDRIRQRFGDNYSRVDDVIDNYSNRYLQPDGNVIYTKKVGRGRSAATDVVVMNESGDIVTVIAVQDQKSLEALGSRYN